MKVRLGFVSNSSSASFSLNTKYINQKDVNDILERIRKEGGDDWGISYGSNRIEGSAVIDNINDGMLNSSPAL